MFYTICKKYFPVFILLLNVSLVKAQLGKEAWHWQFGSHASIDFSTGVPITTDTSSLNIYEGSASISDPNTGQLLFYTDGTTAWDKNNNQMPNGFGMIGGQGSSTQAALIVPKPGSTTIYYLISCDQGGYLSPNQGIHYSIVDMSLHGGLGDVVSGAKNLLLTPPPATEKLTAIRHSNCKDYWVITHPFNANAFNAYLVTANGIDTIPVVSYIGTSQINTSGKFYETIGYLKASPNAKRLACAVYYMNFFEIYDFDNSTGIISNPILITENSTSFYPYGVAFSPNNSKLFVSIDFDLSTFGLSYINEYDLTSGNSTGINSSKVTIAEHLVESGALQLAPDKKIYYANNYPYLQVINNPNNMGSSCNYQNNGTNTFNSRIYSEFGLPNFIEANTNYASGSSAISLCSFLNYTLNVSANNSNYQWFNGDTSQSITVNTFGNYWVSSTDSIHCIEIDTFHIIQLQAPVINILHDTFACGNTLVPVSINASYANTSTYLWSNGFNAPIQTISDTGIYWVDYTLNNFCISRDSFMIHLYPYPIPINLGDDTTFCLGKKLLNAYAPGCSYIWNTGETTSSIIATRANDYWVQVNYKGCKVYDSLIVYPEYNAFDFTLSNVVTPNNDGINDFIDFNKYQFSSLQLDIYDRWGNKVLESNDPAYIWRPNEDDGTYFYIIQYKIDCGTETQSKTLKGFITIFK